MNEMQIFRETFSRKIPIKPLTMTLGVIFIFQRLGHFGPLQAPYLTRNHEIFSESLLFSCYYGGRTSPGRRTSGLRKVEAAA